MSRDRGFVTVAVLGLATALLAVTTLLALLGAVAVARHRAASAADLAALTGARHLLDGTACLAARRVARDQAAELESCRDERTSVTVEVGVRVGLLGTARARARAGPSASGQTGN